MNLIRVIFLAAIAALPVTAGDDPFAGTWKLDASKSKVPSSVQAVTAVRIETGSAGIRLMEQRTTNTGQKYELAVSVECSGKIYGVIGSPEFESVKCWPADSRAIQFEFSQGGAAVEWQHLEVSKNGATLKISSSVKSGTGKQTSFAAAYNRE